ncbi:MAG: toll/interleukin-1 receptor domain-containing protein [Terracidiphilus sp.]
MFTTETRYERIKPADQRKTTLLAAQWYKYPSRKAGMNDDLNQCPSCSAPLTQIGKFWICPQHGQVQPDKPTGPMRIFLSYGHDANAELVDRICTDLKRRGHDVWFDKSDIHFGDDWRRQITDGIVGSNRVLSFLSKYSTRDPGVCLDELAIAIGVKGGNIQTILVESETEVKAPPSIGHIQWLDMHDWKERRASDEAAWKDWYQGKLAEIVRVIESEESRRFAGEIAALEGYLQPISSDSRIAQLLKKPLVGRTWLFDSVDQWRNSNACSSRLFWITGAPGVGKSAFAAHLAHFGRDKVIAVQFIEYDKPDHRNPQRIVRTLAFQLATRLPDYRKLLLDLPEIDELDRKNPAELFDYLLANPLKLTIGGGRERYLIVIDALDEAGGCGRNELVEMLASNAQRLPEWICIVATSRPESEVVAPLQGLNPCTLDTSTESNRADIREYLHRELAKQLEAHADADTLVSRILDKSEGVFLYAERFCDDVQQGHISLDRPEQFPQGLGGVFFQYFQRQFPDLEKYRRDVRPALRAILAAREPLPIEILQRLFNWQCEELRDFTRPIESLFPVIFEVGHEVIKPFHKSLADWLAEGGTAGSYFASIREGNRQLADLLWRNYMEEGSELSSYATAHLPEHLEAAGRGNDLSKLLCDSRFMRSRIQNRLFGFGDDLNAVLEDRREKEATHRSTRDWRALASALLNQALILYARGDLDGAMALYKDQERICRELGDNLNLAICLGNQALLLSDMAKPNDAMLLLKEVELICRKAGNRDGLQHTLGNQATILKMQGDLDGAMALYKDQERICRELGNINGLQSSLFNQARILCAHGDLDGALALHKEEESICRKLGNKEGLRASLRSQALVLDARGDLKGAVVLREEEERLERMTHP